MAEIKDAYETTAGFAVVKEEDGSIWTLKQAYLDDSLSHNQKLARAIDLFKQNKLDAFEKYSDKIHGLLTYNLNTLVTI
jgi:hypothetical protein